MDLTNETTNQENPKQLETLEEPSNKGVSQTRSYDCNFCKRGFTNAQALGGHMNIHRKDKSKQQQTLNESIRRRSSSDILNDPHLLSSPNIPTNRKRQPLVVEPSSSSKLLRSRNRSSPGKNESSTSGDASSGRDQTHVEKIQQFPLFGDKYMGNKEDHYQNSSKEGEDQEGIEKGFSCKSHGLSSLEVDLELRLGPDPLPSLSSTRETMK